MSESIEHRKGLSCPHCESKARIRHSRFLTKLYRDGIIECTNLVGCGWRGRFAFELLATLTSPAVEAPDVQLPKSEYVLPERRLAITRKERPHTKDPNDPNRNQIKLFH